MYPFELVPYEPLFFTTGFILYTPHWKQLWYSPLSYAEFGIGKYSLCASDNLLKNGAINLESESTVNLVEYDSWEGEGTWTDGQTGKKDNKNEILEQKTEFSISLFKHLFITLEARISLHF